jgi:hypothetical protein
MFDGLSHSSTSPALDLAKVPAPDLFGPLAEAGITLAALKSLPPHDIARHLSMHGIDVDDLNPHVFGVLSGTPSDGVLAALADNHGQRDL